MSDRNHPSADQGPVEREAAQWLARRDRGLSPCEQDGYLQWLRQDPRHGEALGRHEATLRRMMRLGDWQPALSDDPNPDLFAPRRRWQWLVASFGAAAALLVAGALWWQGPGTDAPPPGTSYVRVNERQALPDGSIVELKDGSQIAIEFSPTERRVRLTGGEAHFTVAKNPDRPFVVEAAGINVRAVGTIFNVRRDATAVDVLVTEGRVKVESPAAPMSAEGTPASEAPLVSAGERAVVDLTAKNPVPRVIGVTAGEVKDTLAWQAPRLQFFETPLAVAVAEFNARNQMRLVLGSPELGAIPIGGTFRFDNVEGFLRLLEVTLDIRAERRNDHEIILKASK
ncbi:MAG: DUF4880 domain-containing protein [Opitutus sp.]|nr:DUF4880 domain-containing protein [Opitutus sp.]